MATELGAREMLTTTRSVRRRLDVDRPVALEVLQDCLTDALQSPTASNRQTWHFIFIQDAATKAELSRLYCEGDASRSMVRPTKQWPAGDPRSQRKAAIAASDLELKAKLHRMPWLVVPCQEGRVDEAGFAEQASWWASILPAVWSFMLGARLRGLGTTWLTGHLAREREAAELLGIPYDSVAQVAMLPIAYTVGTSFKMALRLPIEEVSHLDRW